MLNTLNDSEMMYKEDKNLQSGLASKNEIKRMAGEINTAGSEWLPQQSAKCKRGSECLTAYACLGSPLLNLDLVDSNKRSHCTKREFISDPRQMLTFKNPPLLQNYEKTKELHIVDWLKTNLRIASENSMFWPGTTVNKSSHRLNRKTSFTILLC